LNQLKEVTVPYTVSRQHQWPGGDYVVEVSAGGFDYSNPDALVTKFARLGEWETFLSPVAAVEAAIAICEAWRADGCPEAQIGHGATGGMTMPLDACTYEEAREWAAKREADLPRCDRCGELLPENHFTVPELDDARFCRENCAATAYQECLEQDPVA
jgi:hypothetical protein